MVNGSEARGGVWPPGEGASAQALRRRPISLLFAGWIAAEAGPGRLLPWLPVAFGAGIAVYFALDAEPSPLAGFLPATMAAGLAWRLRARGAVFALLSLIAMAAAGFGTVTLRTAFVTHEVLERPAFNVSLGGFIETREERERTDRFVLRVERASGAPEGVPERVRLSVKKGTAPAVGSYVELRARLLPPLTPLRPGGYDFARDLYFHGIGASGFVLGTIRTVEAPEPQGAWLGYAASVQGLRDAIDQRIRAAIGGDARAIATALLTGRRDAVSEPVNDALFVSGLGHILSISGYHMAVVAGVVFFAARALLALIPALALGFPIKKWSAFAALLAVTFYLLLSGAEVATQRSFVMIAIVLIGVMADRRAVTFRTLAIAALIVMVLAPESVVHPSFQMSFAATLGLVALIEQGMPRLFATPESGTAARVASWGGREIVTLLLASLIAGLATTPFAAFHFHRITPYGALSNLAAMPVVSAFVMPAGLLGLIAMPFGLDGIFWRLMELGIGWMIAVSQWVAALPGAVGRVSAFGPGALLLMSLGMIALALLRTPLRAAGGVLVAAGVGWAALTPVPDIYVSANGNAVAVRGEDGWLRAMRTGSDTFALREWLAADADGRAPTDRSLSDGVACDPSRCVTKDGRGRPVTLARQPQALEEACRSPALIVTARPAPANCQAMAVDRALLQARGAMALRFAGDGYVVMAARPAGFSRPWAVGGDDPAMPVPAAQPSPAARDATPREADIQPGD